MNFLDLPNEIHYKISKYLPLRSFLYIKYIIPIYELIYNIKKKRYKFIIRKYLKKCLFYESDFFD